MKSYTLLAVSLLAVACGGGNDNDNNTSESSQGSLTINLTDAPVDEAANVVVTIAGLSLNHEEGGWVDHNFETPAETDLLTLQKGNTLTLFPEEQVDAGTYQVRLNLHSDEGGGPEHYIVIEEGGTQHELFIPSGSQTGLKLNSTIVVPANGTADYTIDFDVRKSVVLRGNPLNNNGYLLKPVLRLIDNTQAGSITGVIEDTTLLDTNCSDNDPLTHNVIYVFEGAGVIPDDYEEDAAGVQAVTTAVVSLNNDGEYFYATAPLVAGEYTIALTCNADLEDISSGDDELDFKAIETVTVEAGNE